MELISTRCHLSHACDPAFAAVTEGSAHWALLLKQPPSWPRIECWDLIQIECWDLVNFSCCVQTALSALPPQHAHRDPRPRSPGRQVWSIAPNTPSLLQPSLVKEEAALWLHAREQGSHYCYALHGPAGCDKMYVRRHQHYRVNAHAFAGWK